MSLGALEEYAASSRVRFSWSCLSICGWLLALSQWLKENSIMQLDGTHCCYSPLLVLLVRTANSQQIKPDDYCDPPLDLQKHRSELLSSFTQYINRLFYSFCVFESANFVRGGIMQVTMELYKIIGKKHFWKLRDITFDLIFNHSNR